MNSTEVTDNTILDSSGNGNIGVMIGDYSIEKIDKNIPIARRRSSNFSKTQTDRENGAF